MAIQRNTRKDLLNYLILGAFLIISYFPVSSFLFALKNDALTDNFPNKYFFSASLQSGYLPLWNPYINFGLPLYADPGFAFWHPLTWIFGFIGYNLYTLTIELLVYIWLGGIFMYELGKYFNHRYTTCLLMGAMFMCCGFFIGNLQHINFLTCAAFLPLVIKTFLQLQQKFTYRRLIYCAISLYLLAVGGHPAIPFGTAYFLIFIFIGLQSFRMPDQHEKKLLYKPITRNVLLILGLTVLVIPLLYSYQEIFPYFDRANPVQQNASANVGFSFASYISFLFPFATTSNNNFFSNDSLMRNGYFSFLGFAFLLISMFRKKNSYQIVFLAAGLIMLLLSLGGNFKTILYPVLPLLKYIRTNGEFRVFAIFSFIIAGSFPLNKWLTGEKDPLLDKILFIFLAVCLVTLVWVMLHLPDTILFSGNFPVQRGLTNKIKWWLDHLSIYDRLLISSFLLLIYVLAYFFFEPRFPRKNLLSIFIAADLLVFSWMHLPVTGVQKRSVASIENYFSSATPGIPIPRLEPIKNNIRDGEDLSRIIGCWSYYSKQPGTPAYCDYPTLLTNTREYFSSTLPAFINEKPFAFIKGGKDDSSTLAIIGFAPQDLSIESHVAARSSDTLVLLQNYYPRWEANLNKQPIKINPAYISFMSIPLKPGNNHVNFHFKTKNLLLSVLISLIALLAAIVVIAYPERKVLEN